MRTFFVILLLFVASSCHCQTELVRSFDPKCSQPCYGGADANAGKGICTMGIWRCDSADSEPVCENWVDPSARECNGLDNDCDGEVDKLVDVCMSQCGWGTRVCNTNTGQWTECNGPKAQPEVCNGVDDDCDGVIDEVPDLPVEFCYTGSESELTAPFGDCHPGTYKCEGGHKVCRNQKLPSSEVCDNVDNNCNSQVDENVSGCSNGQADEGIHVQAAWNHPNDLDLHLLHPNAGDSHVMFHWANYSGLDCFYGNRTPEWDNPDAGDDNPILDHDITQGIGPENTTILRPVIGHKYTIGLYSFNYAAAPSIVSSSVKVYCGGNLVTTQTHDFARQGQMWVVGTIEYINQTQCVFTFDGFVMP